MFEERRIILASAVPPAERQKLIEDHRVAAQLVTENPFFVALGLKIGVEPLKAKALVLHAPAIEYYNARPIQVGREGGSFVPS